MEKEYRFLDVITGAFVATFLITQIASVKIFALGPFAFPGAIIIFPFAYIFGDVLTEVYGYARTRRIIWISFFSAALMSLVLIIVQRLPAAASWPLQISYEQVLGQIPRVVLGSMLAFWAGEFVNSYVMAKMKLWTNGSKLWSRTIGSTVMGQAIDSIVFAGVAFYGTLPLAVLAKIIGSIYLFKVLYEIIATPLTYVIVGFLKDKEQTDAFDSQTNFSPFKF